MQEDRSFYVYGYIREDYGTYFYIGKGCKDRMFSEVSRSEHFLNIKNKCDYDVFIIEDNLTEQEAYDLERDIITHMVNNEGYSIEIPGYKRNKEKILLITLLVEADQLVNLIPMNLEERKVKLEKEFIYLKKQNRS